ncbi:kinase-like protein [Gigaspora margarita]|uniref:Kinase-like protein n=1 Tax=Gigaspora margarita TaxID=4874 RepID=A0A8H4AVX2_GIGMA|nr:kinase-like protein [Gigaspora margarita]
MSNSNASEKYLKWLKEELEEGNIDFYEYSLFRNVKEIGKGGFGFIYSAEYDYDEVKVAFKTKEATKEFVSELKHLRAMKFNSYINQFYGITIEPKTEYLMLVLQFADGGNLRQYLQRKWHENVFRISLNEIIKIAKQITLGLYRLHENNIIHCDLHPKNILINDGKFLIADFGLIATSQGAPAYIDPLCHQPQVPQIKRNKKSDVYSLGVIFWELTSGTVPFDNAVNGLVVCIQILQGYRYDIIPGTPPNFAGLYQNCWDIDPQKRPTTKEILEILNKISEEIVAEEFITNDNRDLTPILTRNGTPNLLSVGPSVQILNEPNLKNLKKSSTDDAIELKAQGLILYETNNYEDSLNLLSKSLKINPDDADALKFRGLTYFKQKESI